jgi:hypothetical protein
MYVCIYCQEQEPLTANQKKIIFDCEFKYTHKGMMLQAPFLQA